MEALDAKAKEAEKQTAAKQATKAELAAPKGDMESADAVYGEMADEPVDDNPETVLKWIDTRLGQATADDIEAIWTDECLPYLETMFPPDKEEANGIYRRHEKRVAP